MRITRLSLADVKRHARLEIRPAAGLTIVRGPNEAGKSTVHEALELVLFRKADANREDVRTIRRWGAEGDPQIALDFEVDGQQGRLVKRFAGPRAEAELTVDGETIRDFALIQERIATITGIPNEAFFRATASVGHAELSEVAGREPSVSDRLQKAISGVDRGTARARQKLDTAIHRYRTEGSKNPGLLKAVRDEMARLEAEVATGEQALARLEADRAQWAEAHERRSGLEQRLARQVADLAEARRAGSLLAQRDAAQERYGQLKRATELVVEADALQAELPTNLPLATLRPLAGSIGNLAFEVSELEAELAVEAGPAATEESTAQAPHPGRWLLAAVILLFAGALVGTLVSGLPGALGLVVCMLLTLALLAQAFRLAFRRRQEALAGELARQSIAHRQEQRSDLVERHRRRRRELQLALEELGVPDVASAAALLTGVEERAERLAQIEGELRGLGVADRDPVGLARERDAAAGTAERAGHALGSMGDLGRDPVAAIRLAEQLVAQTQPARDAARSEEDQALGRVDANLVDAEGVAELAERLAVARERAAEYERRVRIYETTRQAIEVAEQATLKTAARYLEEHMGPAVERITGGRYREIRVDEQSLGFRVKAPETGAYLDVARLSQGTADQLYLAARLGLVRLVTMDRRPPIILDDPFVTFDPERAQRALEVLRDVAAEQGFQVILLTCSDRYDALADELVVLEAPTAMAADAPAEPGNGRLSGEDAALRAGTADPTEALPDPISGVVDPFRLGGRSAGERPD
jgi:DNA repair exonuclease SbcCD ATPase subunit